MIETVDMFGGKMSMIGLFNLLKGDV